VFVVGCLGDWESAAKVLFEPESLCRNLAPSRKKGETTPTLTKEGTGVSRPGHNEDGWYITEPREKLAKCLTRGIGSRYDGESDTFVYENHGTDSRIKEVDVCPTVTSRWGIGGNNVPLVQSNTPTLTKTDVHGVAQPIPINTMTMLGRPSDNGRMGSGIGKPGDPCPTLTKAHSHAIAFTQSDAGRDASEEISMTLRSGGNGGYPNHAVAFDAYNTSMTGNVTKTLDTGADYHHVPNVFCNVVHPIDFRNLKYHEGSVAGTMQAKATGGYSLNYMTGIQNDMAVRRLTPVECERLQGFPDNYTNIPGAADGPRYKALGNSMAVPVMRWIGQKITEVSKSID
jgi:DNA (cytosine-5)-methyltransferase 1